MILLEINTQKLQIFLQNMHDKKTLKVVGNEKEGGQEGGKW